MIDLQKPLKLLISVTVLTTGAPQEPATGALPTRELAIGAPPQVHLQQAWGTMGTATTGDPERNERCPTQEGEKRKKKNGKLIIEKKKKGENGKKKIGKTKKERRKRRKKEEKRKKVIFSTYI